MNRPVSGYAASGSVELVSAFWKKLEAILSRRWFTTGINLAALVLLSAGLASWTWSLAKPKLPQVIPENSLPVRTERFDIQPLLAAQLFGQAPAIPGRVSLDNIPISSLNLVLTGVVASGGMSYALISVNGQPQEPFAIGQEVLSGAVLQAVYPDRAILVRAGISESLMLEGMAKPLIDMAEADHSPVVHIQSYEQSTNRYKVPLQDLDQALSKPNEFLSQALMVPNAGGGFLVREIQPGSFYEKLGIKIGDVIRNVNSMPVNSVDDAMRAYQRFSSERELRVEIIRAGQPQTLQYTIQ